MIKAVSLPSVVFLLFMGLLVGESDAQTNVAWQPTGVENYYSHGNWQGPFGAFVPDFSLAEQAVIANGGTAYADSSGISPGAIHIGQASGTTGNLEIRSGGSINVQTAGMTSAGVFVGGAGGGSTLAVLPGGSLTATGALESGANLTNIVTLGGAGAGAATVTFGSATFRGTTHVYTNANVSLSGGVAFGATSLYQLELTPAAASTLQAAGAAQFSGALKLNFTGSPAVGASWSLIEASTVSGAFGSVSSNLTLPLGRKLLVQSVPIAGDRQRVEAAIREVIVLNVNRDTGVVSLSQPGTTSIAPDSYTIGSSHDRIVARPARPRRV